ncbi:MAG: hypothetical protein ISP45_03265 [Reyranella sp.]|nr:hypothetical protein [Reyranella sp.]
MNEQLRDECLNSTCFASLAETATLCVVAIYTCWHSFDGLTTLSACPQLRLVVWDSVFGTLATL